MSGIERIAAERQRQIDEEGWTAEHDDTHVEGEMARAAACYASPRLLYEKQEFANQTHYIDPWPWDEQWDGRPHNGNVILPSDPFHVNINERIRQLEKAGALIAAEIDRLLRQEATTS